MDCSIRSCALLVALIVLASGDGHLLFAQDAEPAVSASEKIATDSGEKKEATPEEKRLPVPSPATFKETLELVRDIYKSELQKAKTPTQKQALAKKMIADGVDTEDDSNGRYVLFHMARDLAAESGDVETAFEAIDQMAESYKIDALENQAQAIIKAAGKKKLSSSERSVVVELGLELINRAVAQDKHRLAYEVVVAITGLARKAKDYKLHKQLVARKAEIVGLGKRYIRVKEALTDLEQNPTDSAANQTVGEYRCYIQGEWTKGLPMLALGSDPTLKKMALADLRGASTAVGQVKLGNAWWKLAEETKGTTKTHILWRAAHWYEKALPSLTGLAKSVTQKRLATVGEIPIPKSETRGRSASAPSWANGAIVAYDFEGSGSQPINRAPPTRSGTKSSRVSSAKFIRSSTIKGGAWGKALFLDNARGKSGASFLALPHSDSLNFKGPMSIALWFNMENWKNGGALCTKGPGKGGESFSLDFAGRGIRFYRWPAAGSHVGATTKTSVAKGQWHHVVAVDDGVNLNVYFNGKLEGQRAFPKEAKLNSAPVTFGCRQSGTEAFDLSVRGLMDEIAIWNRALKSEEVKAIFDYSRAGNSYVKTIETGRVNRVRSKR